MKNTFCAWCFEKINTEEPGSVEFPEQSGIFFCSEKCRDRLIVKIRGKKILDHNKLRKRIDRFKRINTHNEKVRLLTSLMEKEKLCSEDLAALHDLLAPKQKLALSVIGLANLAWSVNDKPQKLMAKIDDMVKELRG
jgi:hypothetical protein